MATMTAPDQGGALLAEAEREAEARESVGTFRASRYAPARLESRLKRGEIPRVGERRVTEGRLFVECRKGAAIFCKRRNPSERESIAAEAYLRVVKRYGGELPPVGALLTEEGTISAAGVKLVRRAIDSAVKAPGTWREETEAEAEARAAFTIEEAERAGSLVEAEEAEAGFLPAAPSAIAADMTRALEALGLTRKEARAVIVRAAELSPAEAAEALGIGAGSVAPTVSEGARRLHERYPDGADLVALIADARRLLAEEAEEEAWRALSSYRKSGRPNERPRALEAARRYVGIMLEERGGFLPRGAKEARRAIEAVEGETRRAYTRPGAPLFRADWPMPGRRILPALQGRRRYDWRRLAEARRGALEAARTDARGTAGKRPAPTAGALPAPRRPIPYTRGATWAETAPMPGYVPRPYPWIPDGADSADDGRERYAAPKLRRELVDARAPLSAPVLALVAEVEGRRALEHVRRLEHELERRKAKARRMRALAERRRKLAPGAEAARMRRLLAEAEELTPEERTALGVVADWRAEEAA